MADYIRICYVPIHQKDAVYDGMLRHFRLSLKAVIYAGNRPFYHGGGIHSGVINAKAPCSYLSSDLTQCMCQDVSPAPPRKKVGLVLEGGGALGLAAHRRASVDGEHRVPVD